MARWAISNGSDTAGPPTSAKAKALSGVLCSTPLEDRHRSHYVAYISPKLNGNENIIIFWDAVYIMYLKLTVQIKVLMTILLQNVFETLTSGTLEFVFIHSCSITPQSSSGTSLMMTLCPKHLKLRLWRTTSGVARWLLTGQLSSALFTILIQSACSSFLCVYVGYMCQSTWSDVPLMSPGCWLFAVHAARHYYYYNMWHILWHL